MRSKGKILPLALFAAVLVPVVFFIPVFAATGVVRFVDASDTSKDQNFVRQGGIIVLEVKDSDLDVPIKRVLLPADMTQQANTANVTAGLATITMSATGFLSATATTTASVIAPGDTILIGNDTVRKVVVNVGTGVVTVVKPFTAASSTAAVFKVSSNDTDPGSAQQCPDCAEAEAITIASGGGATFFALSSAPVADSGSIGSPINLANRFASNADTVVNANDLFLSDANGSSVSATTTVTFVTGSTGLVNVNNTQANFLVYALYWGGGINDTGSSAKVTSQADPTGITVALTETGPTTGLFRLAILATSSASDASAVQPKLQVGTNDTVTLRYVDASPAQTVSANLVVETTPPVFSNMSPAHNAATQVSRPVVEADVTDATSGLKDTLINVIFAIDSDLDGDIDATLAPQDVNVKSSGISLDAITNGFRLKQRLPAAMAPANDATVYWWVKSTDVAGNVGILDRQVTISAVNDPCDSNAFSTAFTGGSVANLVGKKPGTTTDVNGCQPFAVKVDFSAPGLASAITGSWWVTSKTSTDKTETDSTKASKTSIRVDFDGDMDGTTIQPSDFLVAGVASSATDWFTGRKQSVFLTVPTMAADARPEVKLVAEVKDAAGNPASAGTISAATDGIAPTFAITLTGTGAGATRNVTNDKMTITIVSDESVSTPFVAVRKLGDETSANPFATATTSPTAVLTATLTFEAEITPVTPVCATCM